MTSEQFVYWLQGYFEITGAESLTDRELIIADHLQSVFNKETPTRGKTPQEVLSELQQDLGKQNVPYYPPTSLPNAVPMPSWPSYPSSPIWSQLPNLQQTQVPSSTWQTPQATCSNTPISTGNGKICGVANGVANLGGALAGGDGC